MLKLQPIKPILGPKSHFSGLNVVFPRRKFSRKRLFYLLLGLFLVSLELVVLPFCSVGLEFSLFLPDVVIFHTLGHGLSLDLTRGDRSGLGWKRCGK